MMMFLRNGEKVYKNYGITKVGGGGGGDEQRLFWELRRETFIRVQTHTDISSCASLTIYLFIPHHRHQK